MCVANLRGYSRLEFRPKSLQSPCPPCCIMMTLPCLLYPKYITVAHKRSGTEKHTLKYKYEKQFLGFTNSHLKCHFKMLKEIFLPFKKANCTLNSKVFKLKFAK